MRQKLCIYHANCADGFGAALAVYTSRKWGIDTEFMPAKYNEPAPDVTGKDVIIVDFSYPRDVLIKMNAQANSLIVLDHHKTAQEELKDLPFAKFDMGKSGAMLAWEFLHFPGKIPVLIRYIQDRDLWQWELPRSAEVNAALYSYPTDFDAWQRFLDDDKIPDLAREGESILRYQEQQIDRATQQWKQCKPTIHLKDGSGVIYRVPTLNAVTLYSEICGELARFWPFACTYRDDGNKRVYDLRRRTGDFDVSVVARQYGGGGHAAAAGFSISLNEAQPLITTLDESSNG